MSATEGWRQRLYVVIFEADTPAGKAFDVGLIALILASVAVVMLESVPQIRAQYGEPLYVAEWVFTGLFTLEYLVRLLCARRPVRYARSFLVWSTCWPFCRLTWQRCFRRSATY